MLDSGQRGPSCSSVKSLIWSPIWNPGPLIIRIDIDCSSDELLLSNVEFRSSGSYYIAQGLGFRCQGLG